MVNEIKWDVICVIVTVVVGPVVAPVGRWEPLDAFLPKGSHVKAQADHTHDREDKRHQDKDAGQTLHRFHEVVERLPQTWRTEFTESQGEKVQIHTETLKHPHTTHTDLAWAGWP